MEREQGEEGGLILLRKEMEEIEKEENGPQPIVATIGGKEPLLQKHPSQEGKGIRYKQQG